MYRYMIRHDNFTAMLHSAKAVIDIMSLMSFQAAAFKFHQGKYKHLSASEVLNLQKKVCTK